VGVEVGVDAVSIDSAIARLQDISQALTSVVIKSAPDYPIENEEPLPMSVAYLASGSFEAVNKDALKFLPKVNVEFHFSRVNLKQAYQQIYAVALEYSKRLQGDPTLAAAVHTIYGNGDDTVPFTVRPFVWRERTATSAAFATQMLMFEITLKTLESPINP
jgi:hypothetical protein